MRRGDEEKRGAGGEDESRKLNDQLTGFVETKLAEGIKSDGVGVGSNVQEGVQTDNKHCFPKGETRK